jgi:hypothetical protein
VLIHFPRKIIFVKTKKTAGTSLEEALGLTAFEGEPVHSGKLKIYRDGFVAALGVASYPSRSLLLRLRSGGWAPRFALTLRHRLNLSSLRNLRDHSTPEQIQRCVGKSRFAAYTKVTSVRNPFDLMVSAYFYSTREMLNPPNFPDWVAKQRRQRINASIVPSIDESWRIIRFENLEEDLSTVLAEFGLELDGPIPNLKSEFRPQDKRNYRDLYDLKSKLHVEELWADWFEIFNYKW